MATMNIKDPDVHRMAGELAALRRTSLTDAVRQALGEALDLERSHREGIADRLREIGERASAIPGPWLTDDDLYDESGLPR